MLFTRKRQCAMDIVCRILQQIKAVLCLGWGLVLITKWKPVRIIGLLCRVETIDQKMTNFHAK